MQHEPERGFAGIPVRGGTGPGRHLPDHRSPAVRKVAAGVALALLVLLVVWHDRTTWNDDELERAALTAARALESDPDALPEGDVPAERIEELIRDAVIEGGGWQAPSYGVSVEAFGEADLYDVTAVGVTEIGDVICFRLRLPSAHRNATGRVDLAAAWEGACRPPTPPLDWLKPRRPDPSPSASLRTPSAS